MLSLIIRRLLLSVPLVLVVTGISFVLLGLLPGNAARSMLGTNATPEAIAELEHQLGLDQPLAVQYWNWLTGILRGDWGNSLLNHQAVLPDLLSRLGVTLSLLFLAMALAIVLGVLMGVATARNNGFWSGFIDILAVGGLAVPNFWLAFLLVFVFAVQLGWFPAVGYVPPTQSAGSWIYFLVLPVIALALTNITSIAKQTRDSMRDAFASPYVIALRANGVSEGRIVFKHTLRNAAIPVITMVSLLFVGSLTGAVIVEQIFVLPGLGSAVVTATTSRDLPVVQGAALMLTLVVVLLNILIDLAYGWLNPKVRTR